MKKEKKLYEKEIVKRIKRNRKKIKRRIKREVGNEIKGHGAPQTLFFSPHYYCDICDLSHRHTHSRMQNQLSQ